MADFDTGSSVSLLHSAMPAACQRHAFLFCIGCVKDPYLRCTWDNMVIVSPVVKQSLRPVFNQSFYFPVRAPQLQAEAAHELQLARLDRRGERYGGHGERGARGFNSLCHSDKLPLQAVTSLTSWDAKKGFRANPA